MNTPTNPRRVFPPLRPRTAPPSPPPAPKPRADQPSVPEQVCTYVGIHAKTGKRYSVRITRIDGEVVPMRVTQVIDSILIESSDPTLP